MKSCVTSSAGASLSRSTAASSRAALGARARVQRRQRLVEQQHLGLAGRARVPARRAGARPREAARARLRPAARARSARAAPAHARAARPARQPAQRVGHVLPARSDAGRARSPGTRSRSAAAPAASRSRRSVSSQVSPSAGTRPRVGRSRPAAIRSTLVLPAPEGPASARHSPGLDPQRQRRARSAPSAVRPRRSAPVAGHSAASRPAPAPPCTSFTDSRIAADTATSTADRASAASKSVAKRS